MSNKILSQNPNTQGNLGDILQDNIFSPENKFSNLYSQLPIQHDIQKMRFVYQRRFQEKERISIVINDVSFLKIDDILQKTWLKTNQETKKEL